MSFNWNIISECKEKARKKKFNTRKEYQHDYYMRITKQRRKRQMKNHIDDKGNYINSENLSLKQIYDQGYSDGYNARKVEEDLTVTQIADNAFNKIMRGGI